MNVDKSKVKVLGKRILVENEQVDAGAMRLTPGMEEDGMKNTGKIVAVGSIGLLAKMRGVKVGATVFFRKYFRANDGIQDSSLVFVDLENVTGVYQD